MIKKIHFIWFQGHDAAPAALKETPDRWEEMNPGYKVHLWDEWSLHDFIRRHCPTWLPFYLSIGARESRNIRMIKKCDFARLLLLKHYGGWYIDMDCLPVRPLKRLLASGEVHHRLTQFRYGAIHPTKLPRDKAPLPVDFSAYELILSREHRPVEKMGGYTVCNGVIYATPESELLTDVIEDCVSRVNEKVLDFIGPHGLSKWLLTNIERVKGRTLVLPPFYFLWQPRDMGAPWEKAISLHLNRMDWADWSKAEPWDI